MEGRGRRSCRRRWDPVLGAGDSAGKQTITSQTKLPCEDSVRLLASRLSAADKAAIRDAKITQVTVRGDDATVTDVLDASLAKLGFTGRTSLHRSSGHWLLLGV